MELYRNWFRHQMLDNRVTGVYGLEINYFKRRLPLPANMTREKERDCETTQQYI
jgi:hypothetical protein